MCCRPIPSQLPKLINLGSAEEINKAVEALGKRFENFTRDLEGGSKEKSLETAYRETAVDLYRKLIAPLRDALGKSSTLYLVLDGTLHGVPFAALTDEDGKYLIESYQIAYLGRSGRDLLRLQSKIAGRGTGRPRGAELRSVGGETAGR